MGDGYYRKMRTVEVPLRQLGPVVRQLAAEGWEPLPQYTTAGLTDHNAVVRVIFGAHKVEPAGPEQHRD